MKRRFWGRLRLFFFNNIDIDFDITITITVFIDITNTVIVVVLSCCRILLLTANKSLCMAVLSIPFVSFSSNWFFLIFISSSSTTSSHWCRNAKKTMTMRTTKDLQNSWNGPLISSSWMKRVYRSTIRLMSMMTVMRTRMTMTTKDLHILLVALIITRMTMNARTAGSYPFCSIHQIRQPSLIMLSCYSFLQSFYIYYEGCRMCPMWWVGQMNQKVARAGQNFENLANNSRFNKRWRWRW